MPACLASCMFARLLPCLLVLLDRTDRSRLKWVGMVWMGLQLNEVKWRGVGGCSGVKSDEANTSEIRTCWCILYLLRGAGDLHPGVNDIYTGGGMEWRDGCVGKAEVDGD